MVESRDAVEEGIRQLIDAIDVVRQTMRSNQLMLKRALKELEKGSDIASTLRSTRAADVREAANVALQALEAARHHSRLTVFAAGLEEGMTIGELARAWGFSRQLASRYAKEARALG